MARNTARKLAQDPSMVHAEVLRDFNGDVSMDAANSATGSVSSVTDSASAVKFNDLLAFTSAQLQVTATSNGPSTVQLTAQGNTITEITGGVTANSTVTTTQNTWTSPLNAPTYSVVIPNTDGTATGNVTVTRENRL